MTNEQITNIENLANQKIIEQIPVTVKLYEKNSKEVENARTRGLPDDVTGPIRIVEIVGLESDLCCGTHVNNLGQLQSIKLLYAEKGKKNKTNLFFLSGNRVLKYLSKCLETEQKLTKLLKCDPSSYADIISKLQQNLKLTNKKLDNLFKEKAVEEAEKLKYLKPKPKYYTHYKNDANSDYVDCFWRTLRDNELLNETFFMLAAGETNGYLLINGNEDDIKTLAPQ